MNTHFSTSYSALQGLTLVLVGGDPRPAQIARLKRAFGLRDVIHCPTRQGDPSPRCFLSALHRPDLVLVVWLCGLSRTNHGRRLRAICNSEFVPWLNCLHIPHPNLLAALIHEHRLVDSILRRRASLMAVETTGGGR